MNATVFRQIGPYTIERQLGSGGMAQVLLATDTRSSKVVALKVVAQSDDEDSREIVEAEQRGAELQKQFSTVSQYVPRVLDTGFAPGYFYIAMEYIDGDDLSTLIARGPVDSVRAAGIAIQLCKFLEEVGRVKTSEEASALYTLLHNDLKPRNVRLVAGDRVKVLDFGAAKSLSLSRKVTRNDFGSIAYLSPECLESGERDRQTDAWALGVLLYEMVAGRAPFRAADTRRLEDRIRSRQSPEPIAASPMALQAIIAKILAPYPANRYSDAGAIRDDLERFLAGTATLAEAEGWPDRPAADVPTRRTRAPLVDEAPTRRTISAPAVAPAPAAEGPQTTKVMPAAPPRPRRRWLKVLLSLIVAAVLGNEMLVAANARRLAATLPAQDFAGLASAFGEYEGIAGQSWLRGWGVQELNHALTKQALVLAERVTDNYRSPAPTVREAQWAQAVEVLQRALTIAPGDRTLRGTLRYAEGHLHRINGDARLARQQAGAQQEFNEALTAFREAASLRPDWPDPFLGLARTFIYGIDDIDRGADAMKKAEALGYTLGSRETAQLADGYRQRGDSLERAAGQLAKMPQEKEFLMRAADAYRQALALYSKIATFGDVPAEIRSTQNHLDKIDHRLADIGQGADRPWE